MEPANFCQLYTHIYELLVMRRKFPSLDMECLTALNWRQAEIFRDFHIGLWHKCYIICAEKICEAAIVLICCEFDNDIHPPNFNHQSFLHANSVQ